MQTLSVDDDVLMYSTRNEVKSVVNERFIRNLKGKSYKKTAHSIKYYLSYLNKLVDVYHNTIIVILIKELIDADYSPLTTKIE